MDFSVDLLYNSEKNMKANLQQLLKDTKTTAVMELNHSTLMKLNKDALVNYVKNLANLVDENIDLCKSAACEVDQLKSEQIKNQKKIIEAQQEQLISVQETVKTEFRSWADVTKTNIQKSTDVSVTTVKEAVKKAVAEDDRSKRFMIYGLDEARDGVEEDLVDAVQATFDKAGISTCPVVHSAYRIGKKTPDKKRSVKVQLTCAIHVQQVLRAASKLKSHEGEFKTVYLAPDRTKEQQLAHTKLVIEMKQLITRNPDKYYFIRNSKINFVDKAVPSN